MAKPATKKLAKPISSLAELGKLVGRDAGTMTRWLKRDDWRFGRPPFKRSDVPKILQWAASHLRDRADVSPAGVGIKKKINNGLIAELREQKLRAEVRKIEVGVQQAETLLMKEAGQLIEAASVEDAWAEVGVQIRSGFENLGAQLVGLAMTHGMPRDAASAFKMQIDAAIAGVLRKLSGDATGIEAEERGDGEEEAAVEPDAEGEMDAE